MASRHRLSVSQVADGSGNAIFDFDPPPPGEVIVGSIGIISAPAGALSTVSVGPPGSGLPWGGFSGNATFGPVQAFGQETIRVAATGLVAGTTYLATFIGYSEHEGPDTVIIYPSAIATAVASVSPPTGSLSLVSRQALTAVGTFSFTGIPQTGRDLLLIMQGRSNRGGVARDGVTIRLNADTGLNYEDQQLQALGAAVAAGPTTGVSFGYIGQVPAATAPAGAAGGWQITFPNYVGTTFHKTWITYGSSPQQDAAAGQDAQVFGGRWHNTGAISQIDLAAEIGQLIAGSVASLYMLS